MGLFTKKEEIEKMNEAPDVIVTDLEFLRQESRPTTLEELEKIRFVERCKKSLGTAWTAGFGLAAIQIGIPIRAAWYAMKLNGVTKERLLWNPEIIEAKFPIPFMREGCLSIPDLYIPTIRYQNITVINGESEKFELNGVEAIVVQHEIDHMNGVLCTDRQVKDWKDPERNAPCPCGSGKKFKKCCFISGGLK